MRKTILKKVKDYSCRERIEKIKFSTLLERRLRVELRETFKMIIGITNYGRHFWIFLLKLEIHCQDRFEMNFFLREWYRFERKKQLLYEKKFKKLDDLKKNCNKKNLSEQFGEIYDELLHKIWFVYIVLIMFCAKILSFFSESWCEKIIISGDTQGSVTNK